MAYDAIEIALFFTKFQSTKANMNWKSNLIWIWGNINLSQILRIRLELCNNILQFTYTKFFGEAAARPSNIIFLPTLLPNSLEKE